jgi:hypothetical protein
VVHEPPTVDFTAVGLQNVLSQSDGQVIVQQPNVPQQICQIKRKTSYNLNSRGGNAKKTLTEVQFRRAIHENEGPQNEYNRGPEDEHQRDYNGKIVRVLHLSRNLRYSDLSICLAVDENSTTLTCEQASRLSPGARCSSVSASFGLRDLAEKESDEESAGARAEVRACLQSFLGLVKFTLQLRALVICSWDVRYCGLQFFDFQMKRRLVTELNVDCSLNVRYLLVVFLHLNRLLVNQLLRRKSFGGRSRLHKISSAINTGVQAVEE